jgi:hypothetical protein
MYDLNLMGFIAAQGLPKGERGESQTRIYLIQTGVVEGDDFELTKAGRVGEPGDGNLLARFDLEAAGKLVG